MDTFPSSGPFCGSSYMFQPINPGFISMDDLQTGQFSVLSATSDSAVEDSDQHNFFYKSLVVGSPDAVKSHAQHMLIKLQTHTLELPVRATSNSLTPYTDVAQPRKLKKDGTVKRPMNAFMTFAQIERGHLMVSQPQLNNAVISAHLGEVWRRCPTALKEPYFAHAAWLKELHRQENPDYKYRPRKRKATGESPVVADTAPSSSSISGDEQKPAAKKARKPTNRTGKPIGQAAHVVPTSALSPPTDTQALYVDVSKVGDGTQIVPGLPRQHVVMESQDVTAPEAVATDSSNRKELAPHPEFPHVYPDTTKKLLQGKEILEALDTYEGELEDLLPYIHTIVVQS